MLSFEYMNLRLLSILFLWLPALLPAAKEDTICGHPLKYQVLNSNEPTEGFFWIAGDKKYDVYYHGADFILQAKKGQELWLVTGTSFNPYPSMQLYIDTVYFKNTSESPEKELVIGYSLYSMRPDNSGKSKHIMIIDLHDKMMLLNIATYDYKLNRDENGKYMEYLYECDVDLFHDGIRVTTSEDSDINDARYQLDDGIYIRRGHCFIRHKW
jgi:hypothetical protein